MTKELPELSKDELKTLLISQLTFGPGISQSLFCLPEVIPKVLRLLEESTTKEKDCQKAIDELLGKNETIFALVLSGYTERAIEVLEQMPPKRRMEFFYEEYPYYAGPNHKNPKKEIHDAIVKNPEFKACRDRCIEEFPCKESKIFTEVQLKGDPRCCTGNRNCFMHLSVLSHNSEKDPEALSLFKRAVQYPEVLGNLLSLPEKDEVAELLVKTLGKSDTKNILMESLCMRDLPLLAPGEGRNDIERIKNCSHYDVSEHSVPCRDIISSPEDLEGYVSTQNCVVSVPCIRLNLTGEALALFDAIEQVTVPTVAPAFSKLVPPACGLK